MATHAKVNKFALYLCKLFALKNVKPHNYEGYIVYEFEGTEDALQRMIKYMMVAVEGRRGSKKELSASFKMIEPTGKKNTFNVGLHLDSYSIILKRIEENLYIRKRDMKRAIDAFVGTKSPEKPEK
jgi:hypothetical protein